MQKYFVTASGTDIGKTHLMAGLCWQLRQSRKKVTALKPIISGYTAMHEPNDTARIASSCGLPLTEESAQQISPWRFKAPLSPHFAAKQESRRLSLDEIVAFCNSHTNSAADYLLVEGVGGILVPLNDEHTVLDWMKELRWPVVLVVGSYVGAINHALMSYEILVKHGLTLKAIVVNESEKSPVPLVDMAQTLETFTSPLVPIVKLPWQAATAEPWKTMPPISWICE